LPFGRGRHISARGAAPRQEEAVGVKKVNEENALFDRFLLLFHCYLLQLVNELRVNYLKINLLQNSKNFIFFRFVVGVVKKGIFLKVAINSNGNAVFRLVELRQPSAPTLKLWRKSPALLLRYSFAAHPGLRPPPPQAWRGIANAREPDGLNLWKKNNLRTIGRTSPLLQEFCESRMDYG